MKSYATWLAGFELGETGWWEAESHERLQVYAARAKATHRLRGEAKKFWFATNRFTAVGVGGEIAHLLRVTRIK